ncbi:adaptor protein MecA [Streptococcus dentiloxodontae]
MEMKQISDTTLKIMISMEDLEERGMELKDFLVPQEKTEEFFYAVMDELDLPDNFKNSGMLSFRVTPRKDRVDVFVTKSDLNKDLDFSDLTDMEEYANLSPEEFFKALEKNLMEKGDSAAHEKLKNIEDALEEDLQEDSEAYQPHPQHQNKKSKKYVHYVLGFDDFSQVLTFSKGFDIASESSELFKMNDRYYMTVLLNLKDKPNYYTDTVFARFMEHAKLADKTRAYLKEHAVVLLEDDALSRLQSVEWS